MYRVLNRALVYDCGQVLPKVSEEGFVKGFVQAFTPGLGVWCMFRFCFTRLCTVFCTGCVWEFVYRFSHNV